jgi:predicted TIM-barrel fold metal-dependent hydrolase
MVEEIIDFHGHLFPLEVVEREPVGAMAQVAAKWPLLTSADAQLEAAAAAGTDIKVVNAPISALTAAARFPREELARRTNDALAAEVARHGGRLVALATVDAYAGDTGADEARRAIEDLGFPGIVVDVADGEQLLSDPVARPTLEYAAASRIVVFAHPVNPPRLDQRFRSANAHGVLVARGTESTLATLGLLADSIFRELPDLRVVNAAIGAAALLLAPFLDSRGGDFPAGHEPSASRRHLYVDTMGFDPSFVRYAVDTVGADHVLVGSDWPIAAREPSRSRVQDTLTAAGLDDEQISRLASGNARRLLWDRIPSDALSTASDRRAVLF